ncbi:MAG TPA: alpha/beta fold hydrolase [Vitreimonas sp.]|nr:alpha/beta fold hydrolase [Vitreimonas sp.]
MNFPKTIPDKYYVLHGCPPSEAMLMPKEKRWMNWLADKLQEKGLDATALDMPVSWNPKYVEWKKEFEKYPVTEKTVVVGHSCGGAFIVRWLLDTGRKIHKLILVAPARVPETDDDSRKDLYDFELPREVPHLANEIVIFISNDLPHMMKAFDLYNQALKPRVVRLENKQHFLFFQMNTNEFPELLEEVLR